MVTVAIMVIVLTVAVPGFTSIISANRLTNQANEWLSAFHLARTEAIKLNQNVRLCHSADGIQCSAAPAEGWLGWIVVPEIADPVVVASGIVNADQLILVSSSALSDQADIIRLSPQGLVRTAANAPLNATLRVCIASGSLEDNIRDVEVRSGGRARVVEANSGGTCEAPAN